MVKGTIVDSNTLNRYAYVEGNPITFVDPFGLSAKAGSKTKSNDFWGGIGKGISNLTKKVDWHTVLDVAGMVQVIGNAFDAVNAVYYLAEGDIGTQVFQRYH